jgi:tetraacyldisaccharide 4'-kinase
MRLRSRADGAGAARPTLAARVEAALQRLWWQPQPGLGATVLAPLSALYAAAAALHRLPWRRGWRRPEALPVPVWVVGNLVAGGGGKTPTVIALVQALQAAGRRPGVISRGHGRAALPGPDRGAPLAVGAHSTAPAVGDEPLLIHRRTGVPVWVGRRRAAVARALCRAHPEVDLLVSDDGLQHPALPRVMELLVFDRRGAGNGRLLPAGPLREALPSAGDARQGAHPRRVLYTDGVASTPLPGAIATRTLRQALPLAAWWAGVGAGGPTADVSGTPPGAQPLDTLRGRPLLALAGIAAPQRFFAMLQAAGLTITPCPQPDHAPYTTLPWPAGTPEVVTTEKDAVKLRPEAVGAVKVWVVPLDLALPEGWIARLLAQAEGPSGDAA